MSFSFVKKGVPAILFEMCAFCSQLEHEHAGTLEAITLPVVQRILTGGRCSTVRVWLGVWQQEWTSAELATPEREDTPASSCESVQVHLEAWSKDQPAPAGMQTMLSRLERELDYEAVYAGLHVFPAAYSSIDSVVGHCKRAVLMVPDILAGARPFACMLLLRELLTNAIAHGQSDASPPLVGFCCQLFKESGIMRLVVQDWGPGFDLEAKLREMNREPDLRSRHRGLLIMNTLSEKVAVSPGRVEVICRPGNMTLPDEEEEE